MTTNKTEVFEKLHIRGNPLILFNVWDAGSAAAVAECGARAIATGSWSVAAAYGFADGENLPLALALENLERIVKSVELPVTLDFEGGYATDDHRLGENVKKVIAAGAVGINFEDRIVRGEGLYSIGEQAKRIETIRETAEKAGVSLFINSRTDIFLKNYADYDETHLDEAIARAEAYARAGASGFFAPGLRRPEYIEKLAARAPLPLNIMVLPDAPPNEELAALGVARISYGPAPYRQMIESLKNAARAAFSGLNAEG
ncbi:MAG: isocitrate lyase/phosphoenolpyruvate mutase family protein [Acidobacteria bacterium]|nr:isocitrate lyase/phosphoenolpyruvate mutase family protein [Acidobacteriota bacterium]